MSTPTVYVAAITRAGMAADRNLVGIPVGVGRVEVQARGGCRRTTPGWGCLTARC